MTVYVDELISVGTGGYWCHMVSDTSLDELHEFAAKIGLKREWFQEHPRHPHYDLRPSKRQKACQMGAVPVDARAIPRLSVRMPDPDLDVLKCPDCGREQQDFDGVGLLACENVANPESPCRFCTHPSFTGDACDICGNLDP